MELKGKKVLVVGLGKSGLAAALFLRRRGAQVTVSDLRSAQALSKEIPSLLEAGIAVEAGGHGLLTFRRQDLIVVSPGVPLLTPELVQVRNLGLPIIGELELAARFLQGNVLAITGSNGKTTTTTLCGEIFTAGGLKTLVAGNIGVPVIETVDQSNAGDLVGARGFQLSAGDHGELSPPGRRDSEHHSRPSRPPWHLRELRGDEGEDLRQPDRRRLPGPQRR